MKNEARNLLARRPVQGLRTAASRLSKAQRFGLLIFLAGVGACSDSPMGPARSIDRVEAARVMPAVTDSRTRLATEIENTVVRDRVLHDLTELEMALTNGDGEKARFRVGVVGNVLRDYRLQQGASTTDGADVTAIALMLLVVSDVLDVDFNISAFQ